MEIYVYQSELTITWQSEATMVEALWDFLSILSLCTTGVYWLDKWTYPDKQLV